MALYDVTGSSRRHTSLSSGLFKSDSSTSLQDIVMATSNTKRKRRKRKSRAFSSSGSMTLALLGRDGSQAALLPNTHGRRSKSDGARTEASRAGLSGPETQLRFPLLGPTREETKMFFKMRQMRE